MRPSMIAKKDAGMLGRLLAWLLGSVRVDVLAKAAVELITKGHEAATLENEDLVRLGNKS